ncbi:hypothetical protein J2045_002155 [Peteryoungia aggregata LMG 23059]|uniref:Uncharacterized protein n=1 Tax=Peteryoungia aggregata LMG 23059 TaxID=1368425 RepID=A0ABU0G708_9HYPH|nr:hypothetical protein [Peteryoungia aggregata]MDQ0421128.1 hypothetical protein [Peteryoungia aggregata LMG 23059]
MASSSIARFREPRLKLERAARHASELEYILKDFVGRRPFEMINVGEIDDFPGCFGYKFELTKPFPDDVPLALGDSIHNLRTSLDLLACDLVRLNGASANKVYFPFSHDKEGLEHQIKNKNFDRAADEVVELLRGLKPYRAGNVLLRALHDLDLLDKHQMIIPAVTEAIANVDIVAIDGSIQRLERARFLGNFCDLVLPMGTTIELGDVAPSISFGEGSPEIFRFQPVLDCLQKMGDMTLGIVEMFEHHGFG